MAEPTISVGLPVYNGEPYLPRMIESVVNQDWEDFEFIISDNASTDDTPVICRDYAARDSRIRFDRRDYNEGAASNYNAVFAPARGEYFIWVCHDDLYEPSYLRACLNALRESPRAVVSYSTAKLIDEHDTVCGKYQDPVVVHNACPVERLRGVLSDPHSWCHATMGLTRTQVLRQTRLVGGYIGSDHVLMAELALQGDFIQLPEPLFLRRVHGGQSPSLQANPTAESLAAWYDSRNTRGVACPRMRLLVEHTRAVHRAPLTLRQRWACYQLLRTTSAAGNWTVGMVLGELKRVLRKGVWEKQSLAAIRRARRHYLPHRLWALLAGCRSGNLHRALTAFAPPCPATHSALLEFVAECLDRRSGPEARELLDEWLNGDCELRRSAAIRALGNRRSAPQMR